MAKEDLRIIKTRKLIINAFFELVQEKGYAKVSVSDISNRAKINRNTFYLHYADKDDLVKQIVKEASSTLEGQIGGSNYIKNANLSQISEIELKWGVRKIFKTMEPYKQIFRIILLDSELSGYINGLSETLKKEIAILLHVNNPKSNLIYEYAFSGMFGLIKQWILYSPNTIGETISVFAKLAYSNLQQFKDLN